MNKSYYSLPVFTLNTFMVLFFSFKSLFLIFIFHVDNMRSFDCEVVFSFYWSLLERV